MIDLYAGGELGAWAVARADPSVVRLVVAGDVDVARSAERHGHVVLTEVPRAPGIAALAVRYPHSIDATLLDRYAGAAWGLHPGLLPWGRGPFPWFWALWAGEPAGATLHALTAQLARGAVVEQTMVPVLPDTDTGATVLARVTAAERDLFDRWLPRLASGELPPALPQPPTGGSQHSRAELEHLRDAGWRSLDVRERARLARCLTGVGLPNPVS